MTIEAFGVAELAKLLGTNSQGIYNRRRHGTLNLPPPFSRKPLRWLARDVDIWLESAKRKLASPRPRGRPKKTQKAVAEGNQAL